MKTPLNIRLKVALMKKGLRQIDLAIGIKVNPSLISNIINGRVRPSDELKGVISKYLEMNEEELF